MNTPTTAELTSARSALAERLSAYRDSGEARAVAADAYTLGAVRRLLETDLDPDARIRQALATLYAREEWYDSR